jgi:hypothetical protein
MISGIRGTDNTLFSADPDDFCAQIDRIGCAWLMIGGQPPARPDRRCALRRDRVAVTWHGRAVVEFRGWWLRSCAAGPRHLRGAFYGTGTGVDRTGEHPQVARSQQDLALSLERQPDRLVVGPGQGGQFEERP